MTAEGVRDGAGARAKRIGGLLLLAFAAASLALGLRRELGSGGDGAFPASNAVVAATAHAESRADVVTVFYFHADDRCETCLAIEARTAAAVRTAFAGELASGRLRLVTANYEAPAGRPYRDAFDLSFGSVVVQQGGLDGRRESLDDVWTLIRGEASAFDAYVVARVRAFMGGAR